VSKLGICYIVLVSKQASPDALAHVSGLLTVDAPSSAHLLSLLRSLAKQKLVRFLGDTPAYNRPATRHTPGCRPFTVRPRRTIDTMVDMSSTHFSVKYDGPALVTHEMDVRELAPALIALADMLKAANHTLFGDKADIQVNVKGTFKGGSFGIDLTAVQTMYAQLTSLLAGQGPTAGANLLALLQGLGLIGGAGLGLIGLVKRLRGRRPSQIQYLDNKVVLTVIDETSTERIEVDLATGKLWQDKVVRKTLQQVVRPLMQDGIDVFAAGREGVPESVITRAELPWFTFDETALELNSQIIEQVCLIESVTFKDDNKWKLNNGQTFYAFMEDERFLAGVGDGTIRFGKGDRLRVLMRIAQHDRAGKLETSYHVVEVLEHHIGHQQSLI